MFWTISVLFVILWLLGLLTGYTMHNFIHIAMVIAIIAILVQVEDDCSDLGTCHARKRYAERKAVSGSRKSLYKLAIQSGEKAAQPIISPQICREEGDHFL